MPRRREVVMLVCLACAATGCETEAQKCAKARDAASAGWTTYVQALEHARAGAVAAQRDGQQGLSGDVEPRLAPIAQKVADSRYPRSSEAWLRAYRIAYEDACVHDTECNGLRTQVADAKGT